MEETLEGLREMRVGGIEVAGEFAVEDGGDELLVALYTVVLLEGGDVLEAGLLLGF